MSAQIIMPRVAPAMENGTIIRLLKKEGENIQQGEPFAEVESEKSIFELESLYDGTIYEIFCEEGDLLSVNTPMATILLPGETPESISDAATKNNSVTNESA